MAPEYPDSLLVGTGAAAYLTLDRGATWHRCEGASGKVVGALAGRGREASSLAQRYHFIATGEDIFRSLDLQKGT